MQANRRRALVFCASGAVAIAGHSRFGWATASDDGAIRSVREFGAIGDGLTDDTAAISRAIAFALLHENSILTFDDTTYRVGSSATPGTSLFTLNGTTGFVMRGRPRFRIDRTNARQLTVFDIQMSNVDIEYVEATGDRWSVPLPVAFTRGIIACLVRSPSGAPLANHRFGTIRVTNGLHALLYDANDRRWGRASGVTVGLIDVRDCIYAFNGANAPDKHVIERIVADNVFRGYFVYGIDTGRATIVVGPSYTGIFAGGTCANIAVYTESRAGQSRNRVASTRNIDVTISNTSTRPSLQLSTNSMAPTDSTQGHYNIRAAVTSTDGSGLKISNVHARTGVQDTIAPFSSPKRNIAVRAVLPKSSPCLDPNSYGLWSDTRDLVLACSNFQDSAVVLKQAYLRSGWQVRDRIAE